MRQRHTGSGRPARITVAIAATAVAVLAFGALVGIGVAGVHGGAAQYQYGENVTICHHAGPRGKRVTITVSRKALPAHLRHGDTTGRCTSASRKNAKPAKTAAAKPAAKKQGAPSKATERPATTGAADKGTTTTKPKAKDEPKGTATKGADAAPGSAAQQPAAPAAEPRRETDKGNNGKADESHGNGKGGDNGNGTGKGKGK